MTTSPKSTTAARIDNAITIYAAVSLAVCAVLLAIGAMLGRL